MTPNKRIALNVIATYGRSLYALLLGLFSARWLLQSLGEVDFGLYGLVGGLAAFISFLNGVLAAAISRYYSFSVGAAKRAGNEFAGLAECRAWFNTALSVHTVFPLILVVIGYPIGVHLIKTWLVIPPDRVTDCVWIFRFVCLSCLVHMVNVPFSAMYTAKQYIAELTIYSFVTTTLNFGFLAYMVTHPGVWLVRYGLWACAIAVVPAVIIAIRATIIFPECRLVPSYLFRRERFRQLGAYAVWQLIGSFSGLLKVQGIALVINKFFGPKVNASMTIANSVNAQCSTLSSSMLGAFHPAIITAYGAGDMRRFQGLVNRANKFGVLLAVIFSIPLFLELPKVLELWLKTPPSFTYGLAAFMLVHYVVEIATSGHMIAVHATGNVARYQVYMGSISLLTVPIAVVVVYLTNWVYGICVAMMATLVGYSILRVFLARQIAALPIRPWIVDVVLPLSALIAFTAMSGYLVTLMLPPSVLRIFITGAVCEAVLFTLTWKVLLSREEKHFILARLSPRLPFLRRLQGVS